MKKWTIFFATTTVLLFLGIIFLMKRDGYFEIIKSMIEDKKEYNYENAIYTQRETLFEISPVENVDRLFLGDSITARGEWSEFFPNEKVVNRGIDSDVTNGVLHRLDVVVKENPKKLYLMIGINDIRQNIDPIITRDVYEEILRKLTTDLPDCDIYLESVLPVNSCTGIDNKRVQALNEEIKKLADKYGLTYLNIYDALVDENNDLPKEYSIDGVHMTGAGYTVWLQFLQ